MRSEVGSLSWLINALFSEKPNAKQAKERHGQGVGFRYNAYLEGEVPANGIDLVALAHARAG